jgi:hypothetical protein
MPRTSAGPRRSATWPPTLTLDLTVGRDTRPATSTNGPVPPTAREVVLFVHLSDAALHTQPAAGRLTASDNLAALCRRHHRLKTHGRWSYRMTSLGVFE